jgi:predicted nucleic acid-binding Zn ribbon protein
VSVKTLVCPHCHTQVPEQANVCTGCGAEIVRGLTRRGRSLVGLIFVGLAILVAGVVLRIVEIKHGGPPLPQPKAQDAIFVFPLVIAVVVASYLIGTKVARLIFPSRVRFFRSYQHQ